MRCVLTLVAGAAHPLLEEPVFARVASILPETSKRLWLDSDIAADIHFEASDPLAFQEPIAAALGGAPIDYFLQPVEGRRKKLLVADMDSTMIAQECIDELADFAGIRTHVAAITARAMRGEIDFVPALRERIALLRGLDVSIIDGIVSERLTPTPGAKTLVGTMRAHGAFTLLVSGGFSIFTSKIAALIGFDDHRANRLDVLGGKLTGQVNEPVLDRIAKREILERACRDMKMAPEAVLAVGDGANDLDMLGAAGLGVAFHAKPAVAAAATARVDHGDLTALLYAQGYARTDFSP